LQAVIPSKLVSEEDEESEADECVEGYQVVRVERSMERLNMVSSNVDSGDVVESDQKLECVHDRLVGDSADQRAFVAGSQPALPSPSIRRQLRLQFIPDVVTRSPDASVA
ncbi:MAG: hypothetical protein RLN75_08250, partial [Longimicrobiales bacterium]